MSHSVPADADPRLYWNGQYLLEDDPDEPANYSKAAQEAQRALKLMENCAPRKKLSRDLIARNGSKPPLYHYGIPFTDHDMLKYAKHHHLTLELSLETSEFFDGKSEFDFADISREDEEDPEFMNQLLSAGSSLAAHHIELRCGIMLHLAWPFSLDWDGMLSLWSNYDMSERYSNLVGSRERLQDIVVKLKEAMHEVRASEENVIEWWYEWDNPVGVFTSLE